MSHAFTERMNLADRRLVSRAIRAHGMAMADGVAEATGATRRAADVLLDVVGVRESDLDEREQRELLANLTEWDGLG